MENNNKQGCTEWSKGYDSRSYIRGFESHTLHIFYILNALYNCTRINFFSKKYILLNQKNLKANDDELQIYYYLKYFHEPFLYQVYLYNNQLIFNNAPSTVNYY